MQNSLEILLQQLQDAELGGFDAQKIMRHLIVSAHARRNFTKNP